MTQWLKDGDWETAEVISQGEQRVKFGIKIMNKKTGKTETLNHCFDSKDEAQKEIDKTRKSLDSK